MIRKLLTFSLFIVAISLNSWADYEYNIDLKKDDKIQTVGVDGLVNVSFQYVASYKYKSENRIRITTENISNDFIILFKDNYDTKKVNKLNKSSDFIKNFTFNSGLKKENYVNGCDRCKWDGSEQMIILLPNKPEEWVFSIPDNSASHDIKLPVYICIKKDKRVFFGLIKQTKYEITELHTLTFHIKVEKWSEDDSTYQRIKKESEDFIASLHKGMFCKNKKHSPSLDKQKGEYEATRTKLKNEIDSVCRKNEWVTGEVPYDRYYEIRSKLSDINLGNYVGDCGNHRKEPGPVPNKHSCTFCNFSENRIYETINNIYQRLDQRSITKAQALQEASGPYNCYIKNKSRSKTQTTGGKIQKFYNKIAK